MSKHRPTPPDLFAAGREANLRRAQPLAARMRPTRLDDFVGQEHFLGAGTRRSSDGGWRSCARRRASGG